MPKRRRPGLAAGFFDWTPADAQPGYDLPDAEELDGRLLRHAAGLGHQHNGMPEVRPYRWRRGEAQRDQEIADRLTAIRRVAELRAREREEHPP
jgi:hypothetical protein